MLRCVLQGLTPLVWACKWNQIDIDIAVALLQHPAIDVNLRTTEEVSATVTALLSTSSRCEALSPDQNDTPISFVSNRTASRYVRGISYLSLL